ncbi:putative expansin-like protein 1 protein [Neofusicoccum parvum UCRNP2]|uniref:Putative expansin-like protein 1 protein n=1 Tax=Botryosphaeria parva (strain UCR-NP2) TaxID=1287680 RepID=R1GXP4_BOTPV|nr:putative expansin-like protein 1 protein [Neofusicoccum parvum UCRNP2]
MRFNKAAAGALVAGASLAQAQEYCSDRSTIVVTEYVTLPGPVSSTPVSAASTPLSSDVEGANSSPPDETTSVQIVTITPVPATSTPPMTTSTIYSTTSSVNAEGSTVYQTAYSTTTVCPVTESAASEGELTTHISSTQYTTELHTITQCSECTSTPSPTQWTTSTIYTTSASVDATGGTVYITVPHTTTVCPVTATELPTISSTSTTQVTSTISSKCTNTRTVTVDPEPVTVTVTPSASASGAADGVVGAAAYEPSSSSLISVAVDTPVYTPAPVAAATAGVDGASGASSSSVAVDTPVYTPAPVEPSSSSVAVDTPVYTPAPVESSSVSVAVDTPVYTPAPVAASTPAIAAGVDGASGASSSVAVDTPVYTPVYTPSVAVDTPIYTPAPVVETPSVAVDTPVYTPAPSSSAPAVSVESVASSSSIVTPSSSVAQSTFVTSSAPAATSSDAGLIGTVGGTVTSLTEAVTGEATYYTGDVSAGTCSFTGYSLPASIFGTALSDSNWDDASNCGACVNIKGPSGSSITAMIVDQCPGCGDNHLDLFQEAFTELSALATGVIDVTWEIVECGISTPLTLANKDGASEYWFSMQVVNSNLPVKSLSVSVDGGSTWTETTRTTYNFFEYEQGFGTTTVDVKITSSTGKEVIQKNVTVGSSTSHECDSNF